MATSEFEAVGFRIRTSDTGQLEVSSWGFWTAETAVAFEREALAVCRSLLSLNGCDWNAADMKPQAEHGQIAIRKLMIMLSTMKATNCRIVADNALTMMQFSRLARECKLFVSSICENWNR